MPQRPSFAREFSVEEALLYAAWLYGVESANRSERVRETIRQLDLASVAGARLATLSGGTLQRVYLGQAVVHRPPVLLLDEPTTGVDARHRAELRSLLGELAADRLLVVSTHQSEDVSLLADRVISLGDEEVVFDGTPAGFAGIEDGNVEDLRTHVEFAMSKMGASG